jgi:hypothetical protein
VARASTTFLDSGDPFPTLAFDTVGHGRVVLPGAVASDWAVVLVYRGHW